MVFLIYSSGLFTMSISGIRLKPKSTLNVPTVGIPTTEKTAIEYNANINTAIN